MQERLKKLGLGGQKLGTQRVHEGEGEARIGERSSESLRELKVCMFRLERCDSDDLVARRYCTISSTSTVSGQQPPCRAEIWGVSAVRLGNVEKLPETFLASLKSL